MIRKVDYPTDEEMAAFPKEAREQLYAIEIEALNRIFRDSVADGKPLLDYTAMLVLSTILSAIGWHTLDRLTTEGWSDRKGLILIAVIVTSAYLLTANDGHRCRGQHRPDEVLAVARGSPAVVLEQPHITRALEINSLPVRAALRFHNHADGGRDRPAIQDASQSPAGAGAEVRPHGITDNHSLAANYHRALLLPLTNSDSNSTSSSVG